MAKSFRANGPHRKSATLRFQLVLLLGMVLWLVPGWSQSTPAARKPFGDATSREHPARVRSYDLQQVLLRLTLDERQKSVAGTSTLVLRPLHPGLEVVEVDSAELEIHSVTLAGGTSLPFEQVAESLRIHLPQPANPPDRLTIQIQYQGNPRKGLFFVAPDRAYPRNPVEIWSQGEMEDSHFWFPVYDYPNDKATSEGFYTVNEEFTVISNGRLLDVAADPAQHTKTFHWKQEIPHSTYLISVVAGRFERYTDQAGTVPLEYYVPPGTGQEKALRSFADTPPALRFFADRMGLPYPYPKYSQVTVRSFTFGGMENISATTLSDRTLHEEVSEPQANSVDLVTHELAHQWFGDLLTCADWSELWLNEGFATFWADFYREHRFGRDEYLYSLLQEQKRYLEEDQQRYRRPLVTTFYTDPSDLFDRTTYQKGAVVLDMLRFLLGEERFFAALRLYAREHQQQTVVTDDLRKAMEQVSGENLAWFFDQWIYKAGYPELEVNQQWDEAERRLRLIVEQKQVLDEMTPLFRMPVDVEFTTAAGKKTFRIEFSQAREDFTFSLDSQPRMTRFDPENHILKTLHFSKPVAELVYQLEHDPAVPGRIWASEQLGRMGNQPEVVGALGASLATDRFWGVRGAAAAALEQIRSVEAREALAAGLKDSDPRVRQAAMRAFGGFPKDEQAARRAEALYRSDPNPVTAAEAAFSIGRIRAKNARNFLEKALRRDSDQDVIRRYALSGLGELGERKNWGRVEEWTRYGHPSQTRVVAVETLGKLGQGDDKTAERLMALLEDPDLFVRQRAIVALGEGRYQKARAALLRSLRSEVYFLTRRAAQTALERLGASPTPTASAATSALFRQPSPASSSPPVPFLQPALAHVASVP